jgi:spoIIIJ-associated protein
MSDDTDVTTRPNDLEDHSPQGDDAAAEPNGLDDLDAAADHVAVDETAQPPAGEAARRLIQEQEHADVESQADADLEAEGDVDDEVEGVGPTGSRRGGGSRVRLLEREGEVAADFLERLLDIADLDGDIEVDIDGDRASVAIVDSEDGRVPRRMVGSDGKVLDALQELTRLAVQAETGERSRLMLDIAGHRAQRRAVVIEIAQTAIAEVKTTGAQKALEDMSAFERKIVHDEVAAAGLGSESEGVEPHRHIIVFPA